MTAEGADTMKLHTTIDDLIAQEITPSLDGAEPNFDVDKLVEELEKAGFIEYVTTGNLSCDGFRFVHKDGGPSFWDLVQQIDAEAVAEAAEATAEQGDDE